MKVYVVEKVTITDDEIVDDQIFGVFSTMDKARECKSALYRKIKELDGDYEEFVCITELELDETSGGFKEYMKL